MYNFRLISPKVGNSKYFLVDFQPVYDIYYSKSTSVVYSPGLHIMKSLSRLNFAPLSTAEPALTSQILFYSIKH